MSPLSGAKRKKRRHRGITDVDPHRKWRCTAAVDDDCPISYSITIIGDGEHPGRPFDAERSRRLQVDDELEFGRLQHRQVGGLGALDDAARIDADPMKHVREDAAAARPLLVRRPGYADRYADRA